MKMNPHLNFKVEVSAEVLRVRKQKSLMERSKQFHQIQFSPRQSVFQQSFCQASFLSQDLSPVLNTTRAQQLMY